MKRSHVAFPIYTSPILLLIALVETQLNGAYPTDADSIGIPLFTYLLFFYPISLYLLSNVPNGEQQSPRSIFWNTRSHFFSAISLGLTVYPLSFFWLAFIQIGIASGSVGTVLISTGMLTSIILARTFAIQTPRQQNKSLNPTSDPWRVE